MKLVSVLATLLVASFAQAWSNNYVELKGGRTVSVDAAEASNQDGIVSLRVEVTNKEAFQEPQALVVDEENDFRCTIERVLLLESAYNAKTKTFKQAYEVKVSWLPGADLSSCTVAVKHPSLQEAKVVLYMEYQAESLTPIEEGPRDWY